jgi:hypothetical protein
VDRVGIAGVRGSHSDPVSVSQSGNGGTGGAIGCLSAQGRAFSSLPRPNGFDFTSSEISEALVRQLHRCKFLDDANNIVPLEGKR